MESEYIIGITIAIVIVCGLFVFLMLVNWIDTEYVKNIFRIRNRNKLIINRFYVKVDHYDYETWERDNIMVFRVTEIGKRKVRFNPWGTAGEYEEGRFKERPKDAMSLPKKDFLLYYRLIPLTSAEKKREVFDEQLQDVIE